MVPKKCKFLKAFINVNRLKKNVTLGNFFNSESLFPLFRGDFVLGKAWGRASYHNKGNGPQEALHSNKQFHLLFLKGEGHWMLWYWIKAGIRKASKSKSLQHCVGGSVQYGNCNPMSVLLGTLFKMTMNMTIPSTDSRETPHSISCKNWENLVGPGCTNTICLFAFSMYLHTALLLGEF